MVSPDLVQKALELIGKRAANYEYFFDRLDSPAWIHPLYQHGFFKNPPAVEREGDYVRYPRWPESQYLARMARIPEAQQEVLNIALQIPDTDNVRVHEDLVDIALSLPPDLAAQLVPKAERWLQAEHYLLLPEKLGDLIVHLAKGQETEAALRLARVVLSVAPDLTAARELGVPHRHFDEWQYGQIVEKHIPILVEIAGEAALDLLCDTLEATVRISGAYGTENNFRDNSYIWRPAIEDHELNDSEDLKNLLVSAVRDAVEGLARRNPGEVGHLVARLEARRWPIFQRIALHLLRSFPDAAPRLVAERLTDRSRFESIDLHHEYVLLLRDCFDRLEEREREAILSWIEEGPDLGRRQDGRERETGQRPVDEEVQLYKRHWQLNRLAPIAHTLPPDWKRYYEQLVRELGPAKHPEFLFNFETWVGPTSPKTVEELRAMGVDALLDYLRTWKPTENWRDPSREGLGHALSALVKSEPEPFAGAAPRFQGLDPIYVQALLSGLREAVHNGRTFAWEPVISLAQWVIAQDRQVLGEGSEYSVLNLGWVWTRKALAHLLYDGFETGPAEIPFCLREQVWSILRPLTDDPDPTPEFEARYGGSNMDPATLSINTVRGEAMHAIVRYALWVRRHLKASPDGRTSVGRGFDAMPEVRDVLDFHLDPDRDPSLAVRAVYGQWFPWLAFLDSRWAATRKDAIFPAAPDQEARREAAWEAYVVFCRPYDVAFELLKDQYAWAIERIGAYTAGKRHVGNPEQRLAEHLMELYCRGRLALDESDGLLKRFYAKADDNLRAHAMAFIGRGLNNTDGKVSQEILNRLKALWEYRLAAAKDAGSAVEFTKELAAFGWWLISNKFDVEWTLSQLYALLSLVHNVEPYHRVLERLAVIAAEFPLQAVQCIAQILPEDKDGWRIVAAREEVRVILATALGSSVPLAKSIAEDLIHLLGARGYWDFRDLLSPSAARRDADSRQNMN